MKTFDKIIDNTDVDELVKRVYKIINSLDRDDWDASTDMAFLNKCRRKLVKLRSYLAVHATHQQKLYKQTRAHRKVMEAKIEMSYRSDDAFNATEAGLKALVEEGEDRMSAIEHDYNYKQLWNLCDTAEKQIHAIASQLTLLEREYTQSNYN